jgi:prophage antirepressor-like protein
MNELQVFNFQSNEVRTVVKDGEPWWVLKDVCDVLGIQNPTQDAIRLDEDERAMLDIGRQGVYANQYPYLKNER